MVSKEVTEKKDLEKASMDKVGSRSRMSKASPPMQPPLIYDLQYHGMTLFTDNTLLDVAPPVEGISEATQLYLDQCRSVSGVLAPLAAPLSFSEYMDEVQRLREHTTPGPSAVFPAT
eukprot:7794544-Ditylum_brightwellii.AAC.1